jgi:hypothetical protein
MNDKLSGTLLVCPNCRVADMQMYGQYRSFGSITPKGEIVVMRKSKRFTIIIAKEFEMLCDCGYYIKYAGGQISTREYPAAQHEVQ